MSIVHRPAIFLTIFSGPRNSSLLLYPGDTPRFWGVPRVANSALGGGQYIMHVSITTAHPALPLLFGALSPFPSSFLYFRAHNWKGEKPRTSRLADTAVYVGCSAFTSMIIKLRWDNHELQRMMYPLDTEGETGRTEKIANKSIRAYASCKSN